MADAYIGEIRILPYNYTPYGWLACNGQQLLISQYNTLFAIVGGLYGTPTSTQFYLPDLRNRAAMGASTAYPFGKQQGAASVTLDATQVPAHNHIAISNAYSSTSPAPGSNMRFGTDNSASFMTYKTASGAQPTTMSPNTITPVGQGLPHENRQPFLAMQFCICYDGNWPQKP